MTFRWPRGEVSCLRRSVLGWDINVDAFSARDSAIGKSYPSKSYHSHAGSQWVFLQVEVRSNMEGLTLLNLRLLKPVWATSWQAQLWRKREVKCIMLCAVRFGPLSGLPSDITFLKSPSASATLTFWLVTHSHTLSLGTVGWLFPCVTPHFFPYLLPFPLNFPVVCYCFTGCIDLCSSGSFFYSALTYMCADVRLVSLCVCPELNTQ